jgi:hypothetical protein
MMSHDILEHEEMIYCAAEKLKKAMKGPGTDEDILIEEIVSKTDIDRQFIKKKYVTMYGKVKIYCIINIKINFLKIDLKILPLLPKEIRR